METREIVELRGRIKELEAENLQLKMKVLELENANPVYDYGYGSQYEPPKPAPVFYIPCWDKDYFDDLLCQGR